MAGTHRDNIAFQRKQHSPETTRYRTWDGELTFGDREDRETFGPGRQEGRTSRIVFHQGVVNVIVSQENSRERHNVRTALHDIVRVCNAPDPYRMAYPDDMDMIEMDEIPRGYNGRDRSYID